MSDDTDALIIGMAFFSQLSCSLYMKGEIKTCSEYVDVNKVVDILGQEKCAGHLGLHTFTMCDTVSCFMGKGKASALWMLTSDKHKSTLKCLGTNWEVSRDLFKP